MDPAKRTGVCVGGGEGGDPPHLCMAEKTSSNSSLIPGK